MRPDEIALMIDALARTLPPRIDLNNDCAVAEYLSRVCALYDYRPSTMDAHLSAIKERAKEIQLERAA